jgi:hypothetical protein
MMKQKLMTKAIEKAFAKYPLYAQDGKGDEAVVVAKFFGLGRLGHLTWYATEFDPVSGRFFGYVSNASDPWGSELGYFSLDEFENLNQAFYSGKVMAWVERDSSWSPTTLGEVKGVA